jgi:hypothetical protein
MRPKVGRALRAASLAVAVGNASKRSVAVCHGMPHEASTNSEPTWPVLRLLIISSCIPNDVSQQQCRPLGCAASMHMPWHAAAPDPPWYRTVAPYSSYLLPCPRNSVPRCTPPPLPRLAGDSSDLPPLHRGLPCYPLDVPGAGRLADGV